MYFVYVICNRQKGLYVGFANNLERRIGEHNQGLNASTKGIEWILVYYEAFMSENDARKREKMLKQRGQAKRFLKERIQQSIDLGCVELSAR